MPEPGSKAIFLSYAREDAEAVRRIADALRGFGLEVWFDMSELRGGDVWDQKIRRQIKECGLFMPVVSRRTEERGEGYFRLEWKLAVERTHLLADGVPFLFPIVVDDTPESAAIVPEAFLKAQWTRLPGGEPTPQFIEAVKRQLESPRRGPAGSRPPLPPGEPDRARPPRRAAPWAVGVLAVALAAVTFLLVRSRPPAPPAEATPPPSSTVVDDRSVAVLPFANLSEEKDSGFFTDGIQEDILTNLALISGLHVVSRTSVMQYRGTTKTIPQIAKELGVAYILEGSVQRAGTRVRVTGQLIHASNDDHVWARAYDRDISDIFAIQAELATAIAAALKTVITPAEQGIIARRGTSSPEAYEAVLRFRKLFNGQGPVRSARPEMERLLQRAVELDPAYLLGWTELARYELAAYAQESNRSDPKLLATAQSAIARAVALAPEDPVVLHAQGMAARTVGDYAGARRLYNLALEKAPNDAEILIGLATLADNQRLWPEAMGFYRRSWALDPRNPSILWGCYFALCNLRQFEQAADAARQLVALQPDDKVAQAALAIIPFYLRGSRTEIDALRATYTAADLRDPKIQEGEFSWLYHCVGDAAGYVRFQDEHGSDPNFNDDDSKLQYAEALLVMGQTARARAMLQPVLTGLQKAADADPDNALIRVSLVYAQALVGDKPGTDATLDFILRHIKATDSFARQTFYRTNAVIVYAWNGEADKAMDLLEPLMRVPNQNLISVECLRYDIDFYPLHGNARFEAVLNDPRNRQPFTY